MNLRCGSSLIWNSMLGVGVALALSAGACGGDDTEDAQPDAEVGPDLAATFGKTFETYELPAGDEQEVCLQWTLDNEEALYVNAVEMINEGAFHHSNWYTVPEGHFGEDGGEDGYFECEDRGWSQDEAPLVGSVLFIQSTEALNDRSEFPEGVVTKIPPESKVVVDVHFLNATPQDVETEMHIDLDLVHPSEVETVVSPFRLAYEDLDIPPESESRHFAQCDFADHPLMPSNEDDEFEDLELFYLVPHYHRLGNHVHLDTYGGSEGGERLFELSGFNADSMGEVFRPPRDLSGAKGLEFACGFDNPREESVGWGIGDQEMCVFVGFTNADAQFQLLVGDGDTVSRETDDDGMHWHEGNCGVTVLETPDGHGDPTQEEIEGELYVPDSGNERPDELEPECFEIDPESADPADEPSFDNVSQQVFEASCSFSACHGEEGNAAGLSLVGDDLYDTLMDHEVVAATDKPLVEPGEPEESWIYEVMSTCEPEVDSGEFPHMPANSPALLPVDMVAMVRDWIEEGAEGPEEE